MTSKPRTIPQEEKPCLYCGTTYLGSVRSLYCRPGCRWLASEERRLADPSRSLARKVQLKAAKSKWNSNNPKARKYPDDPDWRSRPRAYHGRVTPLLSDDERIRRLKARKRVQRLQRRGASAIGSASAAQLEARLEYWGYLCWVCDAPWEEIDHVKPVSKGGSSLASNLRPICGPCNRRKCAKWSGVPTRNAPAYIRRGIS